MEGASLYLTKTLPEREGMRLAAFLDSKRRTIGADTAALDNQVAEKAAIRCAEAEHTAATTAAARSSAAAASAIEGACKARQRAGLADTVGAWAVQRDRTLRREWDLSDPAQVRNAALPRDVRPLYETGDFGHASGLQTFNAELLDDPRIPPERRERLLRGLAAGEREAAARRSAEAAELSATASSIATSVAAAEALASRVSAAAAHARRDTRAANEDLTAHRAELAAMRRHEAAVAGVAHVTQEEANPWLREDTRTAVSATSPHRLSEMADPKRPEAVIPAFKMDESTAPMDMFSLLQTGLALYGFFMKSRVACCIALVLSVLAFTSRRKNFNWQTFIMGVMFSAMGLFQAIMAEQQTKFSAEAAVAAAGQ